MPTILVVEDGDEYLESLQSFVSGPQYLQAHTAVEALALRRSAAPDLIYLDMRFDRIDPADLVGDIEATAEQLNGDRARALRQLQDHQGLYILDYLDRHGQADLPVILAHDFSREPRRFATLARRYPLLTWVPDGIGAEEIRARIERLVTRGGTRGSWRWPSA